ncbi:hypothetical protein B0J11DRAFT_537463 [Dendryphion nanum]|uniref:AAA+ ATPase domain-containing protein n=1 Tax=Dendryphion nanum TaxID=256645 RepID=A0A9P9DD30_9PLEO|nr:hypothetical protein B0J11DRAFT_537463 [Dendryphion nanum]
MGLAEEFDADVVTLDAQDLAQLAGDYLGEGPEPTPHSIRSLGYETYKYGTDFAHEIEDLATDETLLSAVEEDIQNGMGGGLPGGMGEVSENPAFRVISFGGKMSPKRAIARLAEVISNGQVAPGPLSNIVGSGVASAGIQTGRTQTQSEIQLEDLKLSTLLEALVDANELKRSREPTKKSTVGTIKELTSGPSSGAASKKPKFFEFSISDEGTELDFSAALTDVQREHSSLEVRIRDSQPHTALPDRPKIIYIRDIKELNGTAYGSRIIQKLEDIVRKQRNAGQSVMILGTTSSLDLTPELTATAVRELQADGQAGFARTIVVPVLGESHDNFFAEARMTDASSIAKNALMQQSLSETEKIKFLRVNLRHIEDMMRNLDPEASRNVQQMQVKPFLSMFSEQYRWRVLTYDEVHRISLTAFGLHQLEPSHGLLNWAHVALAMSLLNVSDDMKFAYMKLKGYPAMKETSLRDKYREHLNKANTSSTSSKKLNVLKQLFFNPTTDTYTTTKPDNDTSPSKPSPEELKHQKKLRQIANTCNKYEKRLLQGIVNPDQIKTTFDQIHVPQDTLDAIRTLTSLSLIRPDAFNYGVLATEKVSGALLYGPPGTGKTLLAKAVAKESGSGVLEVSGSQIADKYVGEGEKNVTAIFSLARKMAPCVVFLDEADSILGSRSAGRERTSHREILNQFLKEWDGLSDTSVFVMVATNRPFDMDDAVIRRLPRRLLVDLPTEEDRKKILEIHLRGEKVGEGVDLGALAKKMPFYSGSDIKNVVVFAALACVREENERAVKMANDNANSESETETETKKNDPPSSLHLDPSKSYTFPPHRTLQPHHFEKAIQEVSASISDDMSSLKLIRKFDEQFGDRRGRKKKVGWGFGEVGAGGGGEEGRVRVG